MLRILLMTTVLFCLPGCSGCYKQSSDDIQRKQSEVLLQEATAAVGMPAIKNFRERKILKDILELRDQGGLVTYAYLFSEQTGKLSFFGECIGYPIPYSTQFTNPQKIERAVLESAPKTIHVDVVPQADPNGLFSPQSAEGTWILMKDPNSSDVRPVYVEPRLIVSPFKLKLD